MRFKRQLGIFCAAFLNGRAANNNAIRTKGLIATARAVEIIRKSYR